ncbi:MAG: NAD(P)H-dependent dehydrogenase/reductase [Proteobacteria bacterium]|nr:NAD(P)H-dependent dehydrogenase/reductase [Pseudomonadota bacterium]
MIDLLRTRRSIRKFAKRVLEPEKLSVLEEALLRSPSSRSLNPCEFIFVENSELLLKLSRCKPHGASFLEGAPLGIVVLGDETRCDVWIEDCSIATFIAHLTAHSLGLGSCWIQIRLRPHEGDVTAEEYIQKLLGIPEHVRVLAMVAVGYPDEVKSGRPTESLDQSKVTYSGAH